MSTEDVQKVLICQDTSRATKEIRRLWQDEPCAIGDFIQVSGDCPHHGKEGFITAISECGGTAVYDFRPTCRLAGQPPSLLSIDAVVGDLSVSHYEQL